MIILISTKTQPAKPAFISDKDITRLLDEIFADYTDDELPTSPVALAFELAEWLYEHFRQSVHASGFTCDWELVSILHALMPDEVEALFIEALYNVRFSFCDTIEHATRPTWNEPETPWNSRVTEYFGAVVMPLWAKSEAVGQFSE